MELYFILTVAVIAMMFLILMIAYGSERKLDLIMLLILILVIMVIFYKYGKNDVIYVKSDIDNISYLVRNVADKQKAANILATIRQNMFKLNDYLYANKEKYKDYIEYITNLNTKIKDSIIIESGENSVYTSYSINKGEQIIFCLRSRQDNITFHEINLLMYVVLHEMAHVGCTEYGHTNMFKKIFAFFAERAVELGLYTKIPFNSVPVEYCGLMITESII
jgi:Ca2+/Na+ antiporter